MLLVLGGLVLSSHRDRRSADEMPPVHRTATAVPTAALPTTTTVRAAFYYPWFPETHAWATKYTPTLGQYDSGNPTILNAHVALARQAGLDAFISSWWGRGTPTDRRLTFLLDAARAQDFHVAAYYEPASIVPAPTAAQLSADFSALATRADQEPAWLRVSGRPVLFVYNLGSEASCAATHRLKTANAGRFYLNLKVFKGYDSCPDQPDSWHQYAPARPYDQQGRYSATVSPGFCKFNESRPRLTRDLARFEADLARQVGSGAHWQLITSFNEWGEGTAVEPANEWSSSSGLGSYLTAMKAAYGTAAPAGTTTPPLAESAGGSASPANPGQERGVPGC